MQRWLSIVNDPEKHFCSEECASLYFQATPTERLEMAIGDPYVLRYLKFVQYQAMMHPDTDGRYMEEWSDSLVTVPAPSPAIFDLTLVERP